MFRKAVSQIVSVANKNVVNSPMLKKIPEQVEWQVIESSRRKSTSSKDSDGKNKKTPCEEKKHSPCAEKKASTCAEAEKPSNKSSRASDDNCSHHKDMIPPSSQLSNLKKFELRSDCSSFHMKSCGHD